VNILTFCRILTQTSKEYTRPKKMKTRVASVIVPLIPKNTIHVFVVLS